MKVWSRYAAGALAVILFLMSPVIASAELPAPAWMPSSPILAGSQVILLWIPTPNAVKYNVYLNGAKIGESATVQYMVPAPEQPGEHKFEIAGVDAGGAEGKKSPPGVIRIIKLEPPAQVYTRGAEKAIQVRWDTAKGAIIYNLYRSDKEGAEPTLLGSIQGDSYTDSKVEQGKTYTYYVTSKDLAGKESARSKPATASLFVAAKREEAVKLVLKAVPTRDLEISRLDGDAAIVVFSDMKMGPDGFLYVLDARKNQVVKVNRDSLAAVQTFGCGAEGACQSKLFTAMDFSRDGLLYVNDPWARKVFVFAPEGDFKFEFPIPEVKDKEVLAGVPESNLKKGSLTNGIAIDRKNDIVYVVDESLNTIYKLGAKGELLGFVGRGGKDPDKNLLGPGRAALSPTGELYVSQPLTHIIRVLDPAKGEIVRTIGDKGTGYTGAFLGIGGMSFDPKGNLVVSDSGVHAVQVFDGKTGDYLYHFGGEKPDPANAERAYLDEIRYPVGALVGDQGTLYLFRGDRRQVVSRRVVSK